MVGAEEIDAADRRRACTFDGGVAIKVLEVVVGRFYNDFGTAP